MTYAAERIPPDLAARLVPAAMALNGEPGGVARPTLGIDLAAVGLTPPDHLVRIEFLLMNADTFPLQRVDPWLVGRNEVLVGWVDFVLAHSSKPRIVFWIRPEDAHRLNAHVEFPPSVSLPVLTLAKAGAESICPGDGLPSPEQTA